MNCKFVDKINKENKCLNYYWSHSKGDVCKCRLPEWKKKVGVCPYDSSIQSKCKKIIKLKAKGQKEL